MLHFYPLQCLVLHSSPVALFACCKFFQLHFVHVALFPEVQPGTPQTSMMESFATIISKVVKYCCKALHLRCSPGPGYACSIPCCTFSMLHFFHVTHFKYWKILKIFKMNERPKTQPKNDLKLTTVNFFQFYFHLYIL